MTPRYAFGRFLAGLVIWASLASPAHAQGSADAPATLPDNNDVTDGTDNTDVGLLQFELGSVFARADSTTHTTGVPIALRYGAFEWLELSVGTDGYEWQTAVDPARTEGLGNVQVGARVRMFARRGGLPIIALLPQVSLPTASTTKGLGSGDTDATLAAVTGRDFAHRSHVDVSYGAGRIGEGAGLGRFTQQAAFVSGSLGVTPRVTPALTFSWLSQQDAITGHAVMLTGETVVTLSRRVALDVSAEFGVTDQSPAFTFTTGTSVALGTMDDDDGVHARRHALRFHSRRRRSVKTGRR